MNTRQRFTLAGLLVVASALASLLAAPEVPDPMVSHWNAAGEPDGTLGKPLGLALIPVLTAGLVALFALLPRIDPLGENVAEFRAVYDWFVVVFTAFMVVVHGGVLAFNLGYEFDFLLVVLAAMAVLFYYVGYMLDHAERNWFVGIRTPWTMSSERVWDRTHRLGARLFKAAAGVSLVGLLFADLAIYFLVVPVVLVSLALVVFSYLVYERLEEADCLPGDLG